MDEDIDLSILERLKRKAQQYLSPELSDDDVDAQIRQKALDENYGLTAAQALDVALTPKDLLGPSRYESSILPDQAKNLRLRALDELASGPMNAVNFPMPFAAGAVRSTPTGRLLGTVSEKSMQGGENAVAKDLVQQAEKEGLSPSFVKQIKPIQNEQTGMKPFSAIEGGLKEEIPQAIEKEDPLWPDWFQEIKNTLSARFGDNPPKNGVLYRTPVEKKGETLILDTYGRGDLHNAPTTVGGQLRSSIKDWNQPQPFPSDYGKISEELRSHKGPIILGNKSDPFMWMDSKYNITKNLLNEMEGRALTIRTRSDLVGRDDYLPLLKKNNTTVEMIFPALPGHMQPGDANEFVRIIEPGAPSIQRRMTAVKTLRENGIKVIIKNYEVPKAALKKAGLL